MTIHNYQLCDRLSKLERCAEMAPAGTYETATRAALTVDEAIESVRKIFQGNGFKANGSDPCRDLEAAIYGFLTTSNPHYASDFAASEGFGEHIDGPAGDRVLAQTIANRDSLLELTNKN